LQKGVFRDTGTRTGGNKGEKRQISELVFYNDGLKRRNMSKRARKTGKIREMKRVAGHERKTCLDENWILLHKGGRRTQVGLGKRRNEEKECKKKIGEK